MSGYGSLVRAAALSLGPLEDALADPHALTRLLRQLGYPLSITPETHERIAGVLPVADTLGRLPELVESSQAGGVAGAAAVAELAEATAAVAAAVAGLADLDETDLADLPDVLAKPGVWADLARALPDHLLATQLSLAAPPLFTLLRLLGVCSSGGPGQAPRYRFAWDRLAGALGDPVGNVKEVVRWDAGFSAWPLQRELGLLLGRLGVPVVVRPRLPAVAEAMAGGPVGRPAGSTPTSILFRGATPLGDAAEIGLVLALSAQEGGTIYVGNLAYGSVGASIPLGDTWTLEVGGSIDGTATLGVRIQPSGLALVGGDAALGASIALVGDPDEPWILIGERDGTRVELDGARVRGSASRGRPTSRRRTGSSASTRAPSGSCSTSAAPTPSSGL